VLSSGYRRYLDDGNCIDELQEEFEAWFAKQDKLYDIMDWTKDADSSIGMVFGDLPIGIQEW
jgi:hypothetical protein